MKMQIPATIANAHKAMRLSQTRKSLANKSMSIFCVKVISIVQQMLNASKVNAFVKTDSNPKARFVLTSTNVERILTFVVNARYVSIHLDLIGVNALSK